MSVDMTPIKVFRRELEERVAKYPEIKDWQDISSAWVEKSFKNMFMYNFGWMGRPIIQNPTDIVALQEIIWDVKPDLIIETGIAHGGSLIYSASLLALLDVCDAIENGVTYDPIKSNRKVIGVDIDIREHNMEAMKKHPMYKSLHLIEGSSLEQSTVCQVKKVAKGHKCILVCLDSNHTHEHVTKELELYAPFVSKGSYCIVFDTIIDDLPINMFPNRPWGPGNNPKTAVRKFLANQVEAKRIGYDGEPLSFVQDNHYNNKLMLTSAPEGFLKRM